MTKTWTRYFNCSVLLLIGAFAQISIAEDENTQPSEGRCTHFAATLESAEGIVEYRQEDAYQWQVGVVGEGFCYGEVLRVSQFRAALRLENDTLVRLKEGSVVKFTQPNDSFWIQLKEGVAHFISRTPKAFKISTPYFNAAVDGTEFMLAHQEGVGQVDVFEGQVTVSNDEGQLALTTLESSVIQRDQAPEKIIKVDFSGSAAWSIHYPAIFAHQDNDTERHIDTELQELINTGNFLQALSSIEQKLQVNSDQGNLLLTKASLHLYLGDVDSAFDYLQMVESKGNLSARATMLKALISIAQLNLSEAEKLLATVPSNQDYLQQKQLINSYLLQAQGHIDQAYESLKSVFESSDFDAVIAARYAELALMVGKYSQSLKAAQAIPENHFLFPRSVAYQALVMMREHQNKKALLLLDSAIAKNRNDPFLQLIYGMAKIRLGDDEQGRQHIELAVCLDPANGRYRSYLGRVYDSEARYNESDAQFELAKHIDDDDPTPYFYQGISSQNQYQLVQALSKYSEAEDNDRSSKTIRSTRLVGKDGASRQTMAGTLYKQVGQPELAFSAAAKASGDSPSEFSHRQLLAELYSDEPFRQTAQAMNRGAAMLLKPTGALPPSVGMSEGGVQALKGVGPSELGVNEYNALFIREGASLLSDNASGSLGLLSSNTIFNLYGDGVQLGIGKYYSQFDGFGVNASAKYELSNVFMQWQLSPSISSQIEIIQIQEDTGDLLYRFDDEVFSTEEEYTADDQIKRVGFRYSDAAHTVVFSHADRTVRNVYEDLTEGWEYRTQEEAAAKQTSVGWIYEGTSAQINMGLTSSQFVAIESDDWGEFLNTKQYQFDAYIYGSIPFFNDRASLVFGLDYLHNNSKHSELDLDELAFFDADIPDGDFVLPKIGFQWAFANGFELRTALGQSAQFDSSLFYTLRPTLFAGFDTVFDGPNGQLADFAAMSFEWDFSTRSSFGLQYQWRDIEPYVFFPRVDDVVPHFKLPVENKVMKAYGVTTFGDRVTMAYTLGADQYKREKGLEFQFQDRPIELNTTYLELALNFRICDMCNIEWNGRYVRQRYIRDVTTSDVKGGDNFLVSNINLEYRIPGAGIRLGAGIQNVFDEQFEYHYFDMLTYNKRPGLLAFAEERVYVGSIQLRF